MKREEIELNLPSQLDSIEKAAAEAVKFASQTGFTDDALFAVDLAVREAVTNAVKHGNKFDETKNVHIVLKNSADNFEITVRDFGAGFEVEDVPDPTNPENLMKASGRGILFMNNFMDSIEWFHHPQGGTVVKMLKKR